MIVIRIALLFVLLAAAPASAQNGGPQTPPGGVAPPEWVGKLGAFMRSENHQKLIAYFASELERMRRGDCAQIEVVRIAPLLLGPIQFGVDGEPDEGTWREQIFVQRCDERVIHNVLFEARGGVITPKGLFPGGTRVPLVAQDAVALEMRKYVDQIKGDVPDCRVFVIMDTGVKTMPVLNGPVEKWQEQWTTQRCGRFDDVTVDLRAVRGRLENFRFSG